MMPKSLQEKTLLFAVAVATQAKGKSNFRFASKRSIAKKRTLLPKQFHRSSNRQYKMGSKATHNKSQETNQKPAAAF
ncbi:MAG: hypothetical protein PHH41_05340 [Sulfurimonas sp.]|nr:hypothetical protein [Sulfurimonas sp.]MDD5202549.1 hypothetical protein [Sulfurimonas sp.]